MGERKSDQNKQTRVRQYPQDHHGEIIVFVHATSEGLKCKEITKYVFQNKAVALVESINEHKMKIVFESEEREVAIREANALARVERASYRFYIPAKLAEVQGVISWPKGENIKDFLKNGKGKFNNPAVSEVKVLEATRLLKSSIEASKETLVETGTVIVTFAGQVLPQKLVCDRLVVPVRAFKCREMFCQNCKKYGHTEKRCNNKKLVSEDFKCHQCKANDHENGSATCPRRKIIESRRFKIEKKLRQRTYAEILQNLDPTNTMPNEPPPNVVVTPLVLPKKQPSEWKKKKKEPPQKPAAKIEKNSPQQNLPSTSKGLPPGFRKPEDKDDSLTASIMEFVKSVMDDLKVPEAIQQFILMCTTPYVEKFFTKLTDTFMQKFWGN